MCACVLITCHLHCVACTAYSVQCIGITVRIANYAFGVSLRRVLVESPIRNFYSGMDGETSDADIIEALLRHERSVSGLPFNRHTSVCVPTLRLSDSSTAHRCWWQQQTPPVIAGYNHTQITPGITENIHLLCHESWTQPCALWHSTEFRTVSLLISSQTTGS